MKKRILIVGLALTIGSLVFAVSSLRGEDVSWRESIAAAPAGSIAPRERCANYNPLRSAYFGDLHVHTAFSWDGSGRGLRNTPDQAYRFARGEPLGLPPYDAKGNPTRTISLDRPLDFAAVTDHAESLGEVNLCISPESKNYDTSVCKAFRGEARYGASPKKFSPFIAMMSNVRSKDFCSENGSLCREAAVTAWGQTQQAAEQWYDRSSDCAFTSFHGYEYTWAPSANRVHRNVIFRNESVPELPISAVDEDTPQGLWRSLKSLCIDAPGECDALAIPHNPNHSAGRMFPPGDPKALLAKRKERAQLSAQLEPLVEMMQVKGESECRNGLWGVTGAPDEFCDLEKWVPLNDQKDCENGVGFGKSIGRGCVARTDYARYAIAAGMQEQRELGVNPYRLGFIGSTDNHNGAPGSVEEWSWQGSTALNDASVEQRLKPRIQRNPGGLVGVWAEQNARDSIFDSMRRREVFATSGPRMQVRFFGGWKNFQAADGGQAWCDRPDAIEAGYRAGVPMGDTLGDVPAGASAPFFAVQAQRDAGTAARPGGLLQRLQIIKMQALANGEFHQQVFDVAGGANDATVDPASCAPKGNGADTLCAVWQDPDFDANQSAAYYVRVIENPSCRWTTWTCLGLQKEQRPAACADPGEAKLTQERAWSSPIWYDS
ncbi:MAG: DUF3604 domain-containing protein [Halioglobus sp.]